MHVDTCCLQASCQSAGKVDQQRWNHRRRLCSPNQTRDCHIPDHVWQSQCLLFLRGLRVRQALVPCHRAVHRCHLLSPTATACRTVGIALATHALHPSLLPSSMDPMHTCHIASVIVDLLTQPAMRHDSLVLSTKPVSGSCHTDKLSLP